MSAKESNGNSLSVEAYTRVGNDYRNWMHSAQVLFAGSSTLTKARNRERKRILSAFSKPVRASPALLTLAPELMLAAFGLEALIKAVWLKNGNKLVVGGNYKALPSEQKKSHQLVALCADSDIALNEDETRILNKLSDISRSTGRYPISKRWNDTRPISWSTAYDEVIVRLIDRLWATLKH